MLQLEQLYHIVVGTSVSKKNAPAHRASQKRLTAFVSSGEMKRHHKKLAERTHISQMLLAHIVHGYHVGTGARTRSESQRGDGLRNLLCGDGAIDDDGSLGVAA